MRRTVTSGVTKLSPACTLLPLALACSTAEASRELLPTSLDTTVAALAVADPVASAPAMAAPAPRQPQPDIDTVYPGLRRAYLPAEMQLHACASLATDGSIVGHDCPAGIVVSGPRVVAPTHSDVRVRFEIEASGGVELVSDIVSDDARQLHGRLDRQRLPDGDKRGIGYGVHVFEAAPDVEVRIAVRGPGPSDFRISGLEVEVR